MNCKQKRLLLNMYHILPEHSVAWHFAFGATRVVRQIATKSGNLLMSSGQGSHWPIETLGHRQMPDNY